MNAQILKALLENQGTYLSGEHLSGIAGVSRTSIWKHINQLRADGYVIESIPSKGYQLRPAPDALIREELLMMMEQSQMIRDIVVLKTVGSTNTYGKERGDAGLLVIAEEQSQGKGRLGRTWFTPSGEGLWFSLVLQPDLDPLQAALITQIAAASVWQGVTEISGISAEIKWPNDILSGGKKLCGILTEMTAELGQIQKMVVGIGVNVHTSSFPENLTSVATSIAMQTPAPVSRKNLLCAILKHFEKYYSQLIESGDIEDVITICREHSALLGKEIVILAGGRTETATALDILPSGELLVRKADGKEVPILSGEVSVRKTGN